MSISFKCEHCGRKVEAPDAAGGKRGRCPYCKQTCYIPAPVADDDLYDLAPEDEKDPRDADALRRHEMALLSEMPDAEAAAVPIDQRDDLSPADVQHLVVNFCLDMAGSNHERAAIHQAQLAKVSKTAIEAVDEFLSGKAAEPALDPIPTKILQGFLKTLRDALAQGA